MKVALYYPWLYLTSGAERTILELTGHSRHQWTIFTHRFEPEHTFPGFRERAVVELSRVSVRRSVAPVAGAGLRILRERLPLTPFDALVVVCEGLGDLVLFRNRSRPALCLCLTPLRIAFDPVYRERYLAARPALSRLVVRAGAMLFRVVDRWAWRRYGHVLCISEEVRRRVIAGRLTEASKLEVAHVGLGFEPEPGGSEPGDFFLLPGRIMWTKNVELGIQAFLRFRSLVPELARFRLVVAGIVDEKSKPYLARLEALASGAEGIEFRLLPSDEELRALYRSCYAVLFTAFNEDWGIVPLEAMAFGKPVIATDRGGPRETVVHGTNGFLEPATPEAFAARMVELARNPELAQLIGSAGPAHVRQFSWDGLAARVDCHLDRLVAAAASGRKLIAGTAILGLGLTLAGSAAAQAVVTPAAASGQAPSTVTSPSQASPYRLAPGDVIEVKFFYNPELNETLPIRPDGFISLQLAGEVEAGGLTPGELQERLRRRFTTLVRNPEIAVMVKEFAAQLVYVGGEVNIPGTVELRGPMTCLQAILARGGAKHSAKLRQALLLRRLGSNEALAQVLDLEAVRAGRAADVTLQAYDVVFLPPRRSPRSVGSSRTT